MRERKTINLIVENTNSYLAHVITGTLSVRNGMQNQWSIFIPPLLCLLALRKTMLSLLFHLVPFDLCWYLSLTSFCFSIKRGVFFTGRYNFHFFYLLSLGGVILWVSIIHKSPIATHSNKLNCSSRMICFYDDVLIQLERVGFMQK